MSHQDGLTIWRKPGNPGARPVPVEPGGMGPWGKGRRAGNPPPTSLRPPNPSYPWESCGEALLRLPAAHTAPSWGLPRLQEGWQLATKDLCGTVLRFPQSLKSCCFASWSLVGNCAFLQRVWSGPQVTSGVLSPRWEMLEHQSSPNSGGLSSR